MVNIEYLKSVIHPNQEDQRLQVGDTINDEIIDLLRECKKKDLSKCFAPAELGDRRKFTINTVCPYCDTVFSKEETKNYILNEILRVTYDGCGTRIYNDEYKICPECMVKILEREQLIKKQKEQLALQEKEQLTQYIIDKYILGDDVIYFSHLSSLCQSADEERIASVIRSMRYKDFLQSPYWKAIARYAKNYVSSKCSLCGSQERLSVHHRNYENHGYEHRKEVVMKDLIVLCDDCHKKFHNKLKAHLNTPQND